MTKRAKVKMICYAIVDIHEDVTGNQEIEEVEEVMDIEEFEVDYYLDKIRGSYR